MTVVRDASPFGNDGTYHGGAARAPGLLTGDPAARFDGATAWAEVNAAIGELAGADPLTLCGWAVADAAPGTGRVLVAVNPTSGAIAFNRYLIGFLEGTPGAGHWQLSTQTAGATLFTIEPGDPHPLGAVCFVAAVFGTAAQLLYVNGGLVASSAYAGIGPPASDDRLSIGQDFDSLTLTSQHWDGIIDDVAAFDRALTAGEIAALYATGAGSGDYSAEVLALDPVGYWRLNDLAGFLVGAVGIGA